MRRVFLVIALLCAQVAWSQFVGCQDAWGQEKAAEESGTTKDQPAAQVQQETKDADPAQPQTVNKPVISDGQVEAEAARRQPLHRHPILQRMLVRNNQMRNGVGLRAHRIHPALTKAAQDHANYMARTRDFSHYSNLGPTGRAQKYGFPFGVRENIAYGYASVDSAFAGWQASGGHWANMTSGTTDAGFGYAVSADGTAYWVAVYGNAPVSDEAVVDGMPADEGEVRQASAEEPAPPEEPTAEGSANQTAPSTYYYNSGNSGRRRLFFRNR